MFDMSTSLEDASMKRKSQTGGGDVCVKRLEGCAMRLPSDIDTPYAMDTAILATCQLINNTGWVRARRVMV